MEQSKLVLKDGRELLLEAGSSLGGICARYADREKVMEDWEKLTSENLESVQILQGDVVIGSYEQLKLGNPVLRVDVQPNGTLLASWGIREKTEFEKLADRVTSVEETTDVLTMEALMGGEMA